jgi:hypothetical protein
MVATTNVSFAAISLELDGTPGTAFSMSNAFMRSTLSTGPSTPGTAISVSDVAGAIYKTFTISTNTANFNIYDALVAAGWTNVKRATANVTLVSPSPTTAVQTVLYSSSTANAALESGSFPGSAPANVRIVTGVNTFIVGMGGAGGAGGIASAPAPPVGPPGSPADTNYASDPGDPGLPGGHAIRLTSAATYTIVNSGTIGGGGGGGGGGGDWDSTTTFPPPPCLAADSQVLMYDGTTKNICDIVPGDKLKTLTGEIGTVLYLNPTTLKRHRKFVLLKTNENAKPLRITDDHELWIKDEIGERFGVYNYNCWLQDEIEVPSHKSGDPIYDMKILSPLGVHNFATVDGWSKTSCEWEINSDPEEPVYCIMLDKGVGFIADGFVVANDDWYDEELIGVSWKGV